MNQENRSTNSPNRRQILARMLAVGMASGLWSAATAQQALAAQEKLQGEPNNSLHQNHVQALKAAADTIAPQGKLPGAVRAGVPYLIEFLVNHWMTDAEREFFTSGLDHLDALALSSYKKRFSACTSKQRSLVMHVLRQEQPYQGKAISLSGRLLDPKLPFYLRLRDLVMFCYFNSELGATKATRFIPAPGQFIGDVPMKVWPYQMVL